MSTRFISNNTLSQYSVKTFFLFLIFAGCFFSASEAQYKNKSVASATISTTIVTDIIGVSQISENVPVITKAADQFEIQAKEFQSGIYLTVFNSSYDYSILLPGDKSSYYEKDGSVKINTGSFTIISRDAKQAE